MVVINGVKYACDRCIRGHRVSGCRHVNEPLKMIKRKGRPPTQCSSCKKLRSRVPYLPSQCTCADSGEGSSSDNTGRYDSSSQDISSREYLPEGSKDIQPKPELTPEDVSKLRDQFNVKIELPDGSVLGPNLVSRTEISNTPDHFALPNSSASYHNSRMSNYPGSQYSPPMQAPFAGNDLLETDRFRYQPQYFSRMAGPYNADLYNESTGNNEAAAVMNARGDGGYAPNTGTVSFHPKLVIDNELAASSQALADSLTGIPNMKQTYSEQRNDSVIENGNDLYGSTHIPKLSNLY